MLKKLIRSRQGNFAIMTGLLAVPLLLAVGTAIDYGNMVRIRSDMQSALDAATMQIALEVSSGKSDSELEAFGNKVMLANLDEHIASTENYPVLTYGGMSTESDGSQTVSASAAYDYKLMIIGSVNPVDSLTVGLSVNAKVRSQTGDLACVYALNHTAPRAAEIAGGASIQMDGCVLASNSNDDESIYAGGSSSIHADCAQAAGLISTGTNMTTDCASSRENAWTVPDPFGAIPEPARPMSLKTNPKKKDTTVSPGRYSNLLLDGTKKLDPGIYYVEGSLTIHGDISGSGVFFFMKDGSLTVNGNASLSLQAPTNEDIADYPSLGLDPYSGMLFMNARDNLNPMSFNGTGTTALDGYVYSANGQITYSGNNGTTSTCLRIVADTIKPTGNTGMKSDCSEELGGREARTSGPLYFSL